MMTTNRFRTGLVASVVVAAGVVAAVAQIATGASDARPAAIAEWYPATDLSDDRKLAGLAQDVFVGKVEAEVGRTPSQLPETQFRVRVLQAIKGELSGAVTVNQQGGYDDAGRLHLLEGDTMLVPGRTYLFATRTHEAFGFHTLVPHYGDLPADSPATLADLVARFRVAVAEQIPYDPRTAG